MYDTVKGHPTSSMIRKEEQHGMKIKQKGKW